MKIKEKQKKYYTPNPEEFHIGFEFERIFNPSRTIEECVLDIYYGQYNDEDLKYFKKYDKLRVKYLDKEDIESLGIKVLHECGDLYDFEYDLKLGDEYLGTFLEGFDGKPNIEIYSTKYVIKNKSELKRLLKQLEIN